MVKQFTLSKYLVQLKEIILASCPLLTNKSFAYFHRQKCVLDNLEVVDFSHTKITIGKRNLLARIKYFMKHIFLVFLEIYRDLDSPEIHTKDAADRL